MKILVVIAMEKEAERIASGLVMYEEKEHPLPEWLNTRVWKKIYSRDCELILAISGKSKRFPRANCLGSSITQMVQEAVRILRPDVIINAGAAGGVGKEGARPGDVYVSESFKFHDRNPGDDNHKAYCIGSYPSFPVAEEVLGFKKGIVTTGNSMPSHPEEDKQIKENAAVVKDMEAAYIAELLHRMEGSKIEYFSIKAITDIIDSHEDVQEQFDRNFNMIEKLVGAIHITVKIIAENGLSAIKRHPKSNHNF